MLLFPLLSHAQTITNQLQNDFLTIQFTEKGVLHKIAKQGQVFVDNTVETNRLWEVVLSQPNTSQSDTLRPSDFKLVKFEKHSEQALTIHWADPNKTDYKAVTITTTVTLPANDSLAQWSFQITGTRGHAIDEVVYPVINGIVSNSQSQMAIPTWMGHLYNNPKEDLSNRQSKRASWVYPGMFSMQFMSIYGPDHIGYYTATNDSKSYQKEFRVSVNTVNQLVQEIAHYPTYQPDLNAYSIPYQVLTTGFSGNWFQAATIYRQWGTQQDWAKKSRLKNLQVPEWLLQTGLWIWNRDHMKGVLEPAVSLQKKMDTPISVLWHWWHNSSYDDTFPDYLPPRDGVTPFVKAIGEAKQKGVHAIVYMNQLQWARSTPSWEKEGAEKYAAKNKYGKTNDHVYNIFTGKSLTNMCIATDYWRHKYTGIADTVLNQYGVSGIYMDQACLSRMCFDSTHQHPLGGGNYWMQHSGQLTTEIRDRLNAPVRKTTTLSGEGVSESWLPYLDAFLALQVSMERYAGIATAPIPLFQAVYHPYGVVYGNYSSLLNPPYDSKWPEAERPSDALQLLDASFSMQYRMEQARSFVWGMQPMLANYRSHLQEDRPVEMAFLKQLVKVRQKALPYLLYGEMASSLSLPEHKELIPISKLSIYAGQKEKVTRFEKQYPTIYHTVWKASDQSLGIAIANIGDQSRMVPISFLTQTYQLPFKSGIVEVVSAEETRQIGTFQNGSINFNMPLPARATYVLIIRPN